MRDASGPYSVAVVITTHDQAHFLDEALRSVSAQEVPATEVVVVDDGSTDNPSAVVAAHDAVALVRQPNQGLAAARNRGLHAVRSERVIFLDADDRLRPNAIADGLAAFATTPEAALVYGAHRMIDAEGRPLGPKRYAPVGSDAFEDLLRGNRIGMHGTVMYNRLHLEASGGFDRSLTRCEDYDLYLRLARRAPVISHPGLVAEYRWHGANMSADYRAMVTTVLAVHRAQAPFARASIATARAWKQGRRHWRAYYAGRLLDDAVRAGRAERRPGRSAQLAARAVWTDPGSVARRLAGWPLRRLPLPIAYRVNQLRGRKPPPPLGRVRLGHLNRDEPVSAEFGYDRGTPIDRYYIERFLAANSHLIGGRALEVGDDAYCHRFGAARITRQDILHVDDTNPAATIIGDLTAGALPRGAFDCLVLTQTLHLIHDLAAAVRAIHDSLKPGATALVTVPGITPLDGGEWSDSWSWSLTPTSARRLFSDVFGPAQVSVGAYGNVFAATSFLHGLALEEVEPARLDRYDSRYPVIVAICATRRRSGT